MKHEHDQRHDKNDVDESPGDVKTESESPKDDENDGDGGEHKNVRWLTSNRSSAAHCVHLAPP